jgi:predicted DNA-binding transcriptional regulator AlpA
MTQGERDDVMRRMYMLSPRDQLEVHRVLSTHLGGKMDGETEFERQTLDRKGALDAMRRVAKRLGLATGVAPTVTQYRETWNDVAGEWSSARVIRAWGRYRLAERAFRGEQIPMTAAQRSLRRHSSGKDHRFEPPLVGVRQWLATNPPSEGGPDYDDYVKQHNSQLLCGKTQGPALTQARAVKKNLGLRWPDILRVARGVVDAELLQARYEKERLEVDRGALGIIGMTTIGLVLNQGTQCVYHSRQHDDFPKPVIKVSRQYGWLLADIIAYREGKRFPNRQPLKMQHLIMGCREVAEQVGLTRGGVLSGVYCDTSTVPSPDGRLGTTFYWLRKNVEAWLALPVSRRNKCPRRKPTPAIAHKPRGYFLSDKDLATLNKLADHSLGEQVRIIRSTTAWRETLQPTLDALETNRPKKGPKAVYTSEELEQCLLYQCLAQTSTYAQARTFLAGDEGEKDRIALGFEYSRERGRVGRNLQPTKSESGIPSVTSDDGVPSQVTVWRHQQRFGSEKHTRVYKKLFEWLSEDETFTAGPSEDSKDGRAMMSDINTRSR